MITVENMTATELDYQIARIGKLTARIEEITATRRTTPELLFCRQSIDDARYNAWRIKRHLNIATSADEDAARMIDIPA